MLLIIPISGYVVAANAKTVYPFLGWEAIHAYFTEVTQIPASVWRSNRSLAAGTELSRWAVIFQAIISFVFFGYVREARIKYRHALDYLIGRRQGIAPLPIAGHVSALPDFVTVSQGSEPAASQPIVKQITFTDSRHANVTVEPAQNHVDAMEVPGTSDARPTVPKPAYSPNSPSSTWAPEQLYEVRRDTIAP
jgi:pheromone a factor receptor